MGHSSQKRSERIQREYKENPNLCAQCNMAIPYKNQHVSKFCSRSCSAKFNNARRAKVEKRECAYCGEQYSRSQKQIGKYCSRSCASKSKGQLTLWLSGEISGTTSSGLMGIYIRSYFLEIYHEKCQICGWGERNGYTGNSPLEIHHVDGNYMNNRPENLQLLCPNCHSLTSNYKKLNAGRGRKGRTPS